MKKNSYMDELRKLAGYDEDGNEIDEFGNVEGENPESNNGEDIMSAGNALDEGDYIEGSAESVSEAAEDNEEPPYDTEGSIECHILLKAKDMRHFMFRHNYTSLSGWFGVLISVIALVMVILGYNVYGNIQKIVLIVLALLFTVVQPVQIVLRSRQQIKRQDMFHDTLIYNLCEEGMLVRQGEQHVNIPWDSIRKVIYTSKAIFVYTSPVRAFIFPLDQLEDADKVRRVFAGKTE